MSDAIYSTLVAAIEKPVSEHLWTPDDAITFVPRVLPKVYGDGRALFAISTINQRPAYWIIRACSTWTSYYDSRETSGPDFAEMTDDILTDLEEAFGDGRCGHSGNSLFQPKRYRLKECKCEDCRERGVAKWPMVDGEGGCSWGRMKWPDGFNTENDGYILSALNENAEVKP